MCDILHPHPVLDFGASWRSQEGTRKANSYLPKRGRTNNGYNRDVMFVGCLLYKAIPRAKIKTIGGGQFALLSVSVLLYGVIVIWNGKVLYPTTYALAAAAATITPCPKRVEIRFGLEIDYLWPKLKRVSLFVWFGAQRNSSQRMEMGCLSECCRRHCPIGPYTLARALL